MDKQNILESRNKLFKKFKNINRGKNQPRRKIKRKTKLKKKLILTKQEQNIIAYIKRINSYLDNLEKKDETLYFIALQELEDFIYFYFEDTSKYEYNSKIIYKNVKTNIENFITTKIFNKRLYLNCYNTFKIYFIMDCLQDFIELLKQLDNYMEKEQNNYVFEDDNEKISIEECYEILDLNIDNTYTKKQIIKAYRKKALKYHPDKNINEVDKYTELFKKINKYYKYLIKKKYTTL